MTNYTQRVRAAIYTILTLLAMSLTMTGWYAHGLVKQTPSPTPIASGAYQGCSERLRDTRPLCASFSAPSRNGS
jgi:uncharacterized membrane protein YfbV (UPF0208 family)